MHGLASRGNEKGYFFARAFNGDDRFTRFQAHRVFSGDATMASQYAERHRNKWERKRTRCKKRVMSRARDVGSFLRARKVPSPSCAREGAFSVVLLIFFHEAEVAVYIRTRQFSLSPFPEYFSLIASVYFVVIQTLHSREVN